MATLVTDTLNSKEVTVEARVAERAPWRIRTEEGDYVPAVLIDRARFERLRRLADAAGLFLIFRTENELDRAFNRVLDALVTLEPGDIDPLPEPVHDDT